MMSSNNEDNSYRLQVALVVNYDPREYDEDSRGTIFMASRPFNY